MATVDNSVQTRSQMKAKNFGVPAVIVGLLIVVSIWMAWNYSGIMRWVGEIQFDLLNRWHPAISALALGGLTAIIWRLFVYRASRKADDESARLQQAVTFFRGLTILFNGAGILALLMALPAAFEAWSATSGGEQTRVVLSKGQSTFVDGPVTLRGWRTLGPVARYEEGFLGVGPDLWLVPVATRSTPAGPEYSMFAQVPDRRHPLISSEQPGFARRDALPGEIATLYRRYGMRVDDKATVVFLDRANARRSAVFFLVESLFAAVLAFVFAFIARRQLSRAS